MHRTPSTLYIQRSVFLIFIFVILFAGRCRRHPVDPEVEKAKKVAEATRTKNLLREIKGVNYTEVKRVFDNGLSFSPVGYQLTPEWRISFPSVDSVNIYSPKKGRFLNAPVMFDHDSIFNVAWAWLKLKYIKKDSIKFMVLHVHDDTIVEEKVHVFMTFYTNDYIKSVLHSDTNKLREPTRLDTEYIKTKSILANKIPDSAFASTDPAVLWSKSPLVTCKKDIVPPDDVNGGKVYDNYLLPTYNIDIHHAYQDFSYLFSIFVDERGNMTFRKSNQFISHEFVQSTLDIMKGITDSYLKLYLNVKPGKTLGIPHRSIVLLNVVGYKK
jgi:hypothetical protein